VRIDRRRVAGANAVFEDSGNGGLLAREDPCGTAEGQACGKKPGIDNGFSG
jgi:hypothetical protein